MPEKNKKPVHFLVLKIVGFIGIAVAITGFIMLVSGIKDPEKFILSVVGSFMMTGGLACGFTGMVLGFTPEINRLSAKTRKYVQEENKEDLTEIADTHADIIGGAVQKITGSVREGMKKSKFCKYCGAEIDEDSLYCSMCGKKQSQE